MVMLGALDKTHVRICEQARGVLPVLDEWASVVPTELEEGPHRVLTVSRRAARLLTALRSQRNSSDFPHTPMMSPSKYHTSRLGRSSLPNTCRWIRCPLRFRRKSHGGSGFPVWTSVRHGTSCQLLETRSQAGFPSKRPSACHKQ